MHLGTMIMKMMEEIGHMFVDESCCPEGVSQKDIMDFFTMIITEYETSFDLKNANLSAMKSDIDEYFDNVTSDKDKLVAEIASEAAVEIVAGAASIASAATSWIPGVNFVLSGVSIAAALTELGLELAIEKLQNTIVEKISDSDGKLRAKPSFEKIKTYLDAQTSNTIFFPRLRLGVTILETRAVFIGIVITAMKTTSRKITNEDMKKIVVDWYQTVARNENIIKHLSELYNELEDSPGNVDSTKMDECLSNIPSIDQEQKKVCVSNILAYTISLTIRYDRPYYTTYSMVNKWAKSIELGLKDLNIAGGIAKAGESAEEEVLTGTKAYGMAISFLAGVASIVFGSLQAIHAAEVDHTITKAISQTKDAITKYYEKLVTQSH